MNKTIPDSLRNPQYGLRIALTGPGGRTLSYQDLVQEVNRNAAILQSFGLDHTSTAAIVLPNGPEMALAFLSVAAACIAAPLNPGYRLEEYKFYFSDLDVKAVILLSGQESPARQAAELLEIRILDIQAKANGSAGCFTIVDADDINPATVLNPSPDDIALVLHTSGTTSRPKIVPLTHENLCASAENISQTLSLTRNDLCLNVMPLFHIHGLIGCLLSSLSAGSSIYCTEGFSSAQFFDWMQECHPTWYSAVPTMHQAILSRLHSNQPFENRSHLRFIRSSSAAMPLNVKKDLVEAFKTPVIEAYGMTEASHQIATNLLPPFIQKPGSVGQACGTQIVIFSENTEEILPENQPGEIAIKGPGVTKGYLRNPDANQISFTKHGWFRTGDQGYLDADGYLFITGRLKEIINRGGEKVIPGEIDQILLNHPDVEQALTFAIPNPALGEEIGAAVVRRHEHLTERELREYTRKFLADHKIPRKIVFLDQIPKGSTGKLQRIGLAEKLGLVKNETSVEEAVISPRSELEETIKDIWQHVLKISQFGIRQQFLSLGGDSISAAQIANRISEEFEITISIVDFFEASTIEKQAQWVEARLIEQIEQMTDDEASQALDAFKADGNE